jgi:hypothetical protein
MQPTNFNQLSNPNLLGIYQFGVEINPTEGQEIYTNKQFCKSIEINTYTFNNNVLKEDLIIENEISVIAGITECFDDVIITDIQAQFPLFFITNNIIKIPSKIEYVLRKYVSRKLLRDIHPDKDVAIELCLLFVSQLHQTPSYIFLDPSPSIFL